MTFDELGTARHFAHIVPKSVQGILSHKQDVVNNPDNIFPTIQVLHEAMELHQRQPAFTLVFVGAHPPFFDKYTLKLAKGADEPHIIRRFVQDGQTVYMHESSRQYWEIHRRVFDVCVDFCNMSPLMVEGQASTAPPTSGKIVPADHPQVHQLG